MTTRKDAAAQGTVPDPARPQSRKIAQPDGVKILAGIGRAVNATDAELMRQRPPQKLANKQDWHEG